MRRTDRDPQPPRAQQRLDPILTDVRVGEAGFGYVLSGRLSFWIEERERYDLQAGDALSFPSTLLHRWRNDGPAAAVVLWVNALPAECTRPSDRGRRRYVSAD